MGLKKIFAVILVLISLSLIGIIVIQISWILTMLENKREELHHKMIDAVAQVGQQLVEQRGNSGKGLRLKPGKPWRPSDPFRMELIRPLPIAERITPAEIRDRLRKAFHGRSRKHWRLQSWLSSR